MRKHLLTALMAVILILTLPVTAVYAQDTLTEGGKVLSEMEEELTTYVIVSGSTTSYESVSQVADRSGRLDTRPLTKTEIANLYQNAQDSSTAFSNGVTPNIQNPYSAGSASDENIQSTLIRLNMYRLIAGLTPVEVSEELSDEAQHGAVLLAAVRTLTHYPDQPEDMDDEFYQIAYSATRSSNLSAGYARMEYGIDGCISDNSGTNLTCLGHRRWFLSPALLYVGFGEAMSTGYGGYGTYYAYKVYDKSNDALDYDFVSWPSSGNFPTELLSTKIPWSISLNPNRYKVPSLDEIVVEITNPSGDVEIFDASYNDANTTTGSEKYFNVDNTGYGQGACIICNFGSNYSAFAQSGTYHVKVTGLKSAETGEDVTIEYSITMFSASDYAGGTEVTDEQYYAIEEFVERMYTVCLGRESDSAGKSDWTMKLADHDLSGAEVAYGFIFSEEFQNFNYCNEDFVKQLYRAFLGREYDEAGLADWVSRLESGTTREEVFNGFSQSDEFRAICEAYGITLGDPIEVPQYGTVPHGACSVCGEIDGVTAFVTRLYNICLDREPDEAGLEDWTSQLWDHTKSGSSVALGFVFSQEFTDKNFSNEDFVAYTYTELFLTGKLTKPVRLTG